MRKKAWSSTWTMHESVHGLRRHGYNLMFTVGTSLPKFHKETEIFENSNVFQDVFVRFGGYELPQSSETLPNFLAT